MSPFCLRSLSTSRSFVFLRQGLLGRCCYYWNTGLAYTAYTSCFHRNRAQPQLTAMKTRPSERQPGKKIDEPGLPRKRRDQITAMHKNNVFANCAGMLSPILAAKLGFAPLLPCHSGSRWACQASLVSLRDPGSTPRICHKERCTCKRSRPKKQSSTAEEIPFSET